MGNIKNFNFNTLDLRLSNSDYWDFYLANDDGPIPYCGPLSEGDCFVVWYDFDNLNIYPNSANTSPDIYSLVTWTGATNTGYTFNTIGLTGIDNGLVTFNKTSGDTSNIALLNALTGSTLVIPSADTRLHMTRVTGTTGDYVYPYDIINDLTKPNIGNFASLYGGFFQGYYKIDGSTYEVLPTRVNHAWSAEFWLTTKVYNTTTGTTLNDIYPNNSGFFFYMGTRAENKFWNLWEGSDSGCTHDCTTTACTSGETVSKWCTVPKENEIVLAGDYGLGISLDPPRTDIDLITNTFLVYGQAFNAKPNALTGINSTLIYTSGSTPNIHNVYNGCGNSIDGLGSYRAWEYDGNGIPVSHVRKTLTNETNPFLIYGRGSGIKTTGHTKGCCQGPNDGLGNETAYSFSGTNTPETSINYNIDIIDNALGFRIKPDGSIGYRLLTVTGTCDNITRVYSTGTTIIEGYSTQINLFNPLFWYNVVIKYVTEYKDDCELKNSKPRTGDLKIYINGNLIHTFHEFPEFVGKRLDEYKSKQVGVPFNFSLGGGSQGLLESQTFGGLDLSDRGLPIEQNFAGTFIGGISQFKFNICELSFCQIQNNYSANAGRYM
jgi:hypothetical protein